MSICTFRPVRMPYMGVCSVWHFNGNFKCIESSQYKSFKMKYFYCSVLTITGTRSNLVACVEEIIPKINEVSVVISCSACMMFGFSQSVHRGAPNFTTEVQILVPEPYMGTIIGSGGQKIKAQRKVISIDIKDNHVLVLSFIGIKCSHKGMHYQLYMLQINFVVKIFSDSLPGSNERSISVTGGKAAILSVITYVLTELGEVMVWT